MSEFVPIFLTTIEEQQMIIINSHNRCSELWTRIEGNRKSVIDYVLTSEENGKNGNEMIIGDNNTITPFHI